MKHVVWALATYIEGVAKYGRLGDRCSQIEDITILSGGGSKIRYTPFVVSCYAFKIHRASGPGRISI